VVPWSLFPDEEETFSIAAMAMHTKGIKLYHVKTWDGHTTRIEVRMPTRNSPQTWSRYLLLRACSLGWSMVKICRA
jgi:hypothetical protein